jgi:hypothetical protein
LGGWRGTPLLLFRLWAASAATVVKEYRAMMKGADGDPASGQPAVQSLRTPAPARKVWRR